MLEYYQGILLLTTNRIGSFDVAFKSRIHLAIYYPPLSQPSRRALWRAFLLKASPESVEELDMGGVIDEVAAERLNGRQIRNLVRTASALAISDTQAEVRLTRRHIELALVPMKAFGESIDQGGSPTVEDDGCDGTYGPRKRARMN